MCGVQQMRRNHLDVRSSVISVTSDSVVNDDDDDGTNNNNSNGKNEVKALFDQRELPINDGANDLARLLLTEVRPRSEQTKVVDHGNEISTYYDNKTNETKTKRE